MPETFHCPSCNARLTYTDDMAEVTTCDYCGTSVVVPESLRKKAAPQPVSSGSGGTFVITADAAQPTSSGTTGRGCIVFMGLIAAAGMAALVALLAFVDSDQVTGNLSGFVAGLINGDEVTIRPEAGDDTGPNLPDTAADLLGVNPFVLQIGTDEEGTGPGRFEDLRYVAVDAQGNIYTAELQSPRIQVFAPDGTFTTQWNLPTDAPIRAMDVARDGTVFVIQGFTTSLYASDGTPLGTLPDLGNFDTITTLPDGSIFVADDDNIFRLDANNTVTLELPEAISQRADTPELGPEIAGLGSGGFVYLSPNNNSFYFFDADGVFQNRITEEERLRAANDVAVDGDGNIYVSAIFGVQVYSPEGQFLGEITIDNGPYFGLTVDDADQLYIASRTRLVVLDVSSY